MKLNSFYLGSIVFFALAMAHATDNQEIQVSSTSKCSIGGYTDLVKCSTGQSADIKLSEQKTRTAEQLEVAARQWVNPELDIESVAKGSEKKEQSATLFFSFNLGGKRFAKISEARAEYEKAKVGSLLDVQNSRLSLMLALHRISQLQREIKIEEESVSTFSKIIKQYQSRPALSPEQDVSLSVFKMALSDHQLSLVEVKSDLEKILSEVVVQTGLLKNDILSNLPKPTVNWVKISSIESAEESPQLKLAKADLNVSRSLKKQADADSWPDLKIGPTVQVTKEANLPSETLAGVSLSMPLPVLTWNGGNREYARQRIVESEMNYEYTKNKMASHREQLIKKYSNLVDALDLVNSKSISEKHEKIERQFFKGTVPSSLIIEAHRQLFDLESKRNQSELETLNTLGQILIMDSKFSEVIL